MFDLEIHLTDRPGELARLGRTLGEAGVSVEGGGMFVAAGTGIAHFLVADDRAALAALAARGIPVVACREVLTVRLRQDRPGELGALTAAMADAGVTIDTLYSDHDHRLVLLVDDVPSAAEVQAAWAGHGDATRKSSPVDGRRPSGRVADTERATRGQGWV